jgi:hypothetical protein
MKYRIHFYDHHVSGTDVASELSNNDTYESEAVAISDAEDVCRRINRDEPDAKYEVRYRIVPVEEDDDSL